VAEKARLDVLDLERFPQERIGKQINLTDGQIVCRAPPCVHELQFIRRQDLSCHRHGIPFHRVHWKCPVIGWQLRTLTAVPVSSIASTLRRAWCRHLDPDQPQAPALDRLRSSVEKPA